jgi:hypothetical protein
MSFQIFDVICLLCLGFIQALDVLFKIHDDLIFVLYLPLKVLILERKLSYRLFLGKLGCVESSICRSKVIDLIFEDTILVFKQLNLMIQVVYFLILIFYFCLKVSFLSL